jgi:hypothetical protein
VVAASFEEELEDEGDEFASANQRGSVAPASYNIIPATAPRRSDARVSGPSSSRTEIEFKGMPVNDATQSSAPAELDEELVIDISELPEPTPAVSARLRSGKTAIRTSSPSSSDAGGWRGR